jgi:hypothetical protein
MKAITMKSKLFSFFTVLLLSNSALAGGSSAGNGGNTIVCFDGNNQIKTVELLDFYEARVKRGITPDLGDDSLSADDKVRLVLTRLKKLSPWLSITLETEFDNFKFDSVFLPGIRLVTVDDSDHLFVPAGCQQEQTAVQKAPEFPGDKLYNIDQDLWNHMDANNRAGLILHEIFYRHAIRFGNPENSVPVRFFVSSIASATSISEAEYVDVLRQLKFPQVYLHDHNFVINKAMPYFIDGVFYGGDLYGDALVPIQNKLLPITSIRFAKTGAVSDVQLEKPAYLKVPGQSLWFAAKTVIGLRSDETVIAGTPLPQNAEFKFDGLYDLRLSESTIGPIFVAFKGDHLDRCTNCQGQVTIAGQAQVFDVDSYEENMFLEGLGVTVHLTHPSIFEYLGREFSVQDELDATTSGQLFVATLTTPTRFTVRQTEILFGTGKIQFYVNNQLEAGTLGEDTVLTALDGSQTPYLKGMQLHYDGNGHVIDAVEPTN